MTENVIQLGTAKAPPVVKEPHQGVIEFLERLLQEARAGDVVGVACAYQNGEWRSGYSVVGFVGGFSMAGATHSLLQDLGDINRGLTEAEGDE